MSEIPKTTPREQKVLFAIGERTAYGLEIKETIEKCTNGRTKLTIGALYPLLHSLEKKGLVVSNWGDESTCGARRRYYNITDLGRDTITDILATQQRLLQGY
ncbi:MAG: PadR family transcriptional regulator [Cyanobacteria bacterium P01_E01_bin.42]